MIKAVIFDCFGVLTTDGWLAFREIHFADKPDEHEQAMVANKQVDSGLIGYEDFLHSVAKLAGVSYEETKRMIENNVSNNKLFEYIRDNLKQYYKIGILSNAGENWLHELFEEWQNDLVDEAVFSYELRTAKPDPIMYETIATRLGMLPEECVFIDDQPRFVDGAKQVGMQAIHFVDTAQTLRELEEILHA